MMGTTPELTAELERVKGRRIAAITAEVPRGAEAFIFPVAARKRTADPIGVNAPQVLSVIAIHAANAKFDKSWRSVLAGTLFTPPIPIDDIVAELPLIRDL